MRAASAVLKNCGVSAVVLGFGGVLEGADKGVFSNTVE
jgi:hypothetical protein